MKQSICFLLVLSLSISLFAQNRTTFRSDIDTAAEAEIKSLELLLTGLLASGDIDKYSGYLTDDYVRVAANGTVSTKQQVLDGFRKSKMQGTMNPHDLSVRIYGNTAIMLGILDIESKSGETITRRTSIINKVFIKKDGKWYLASMQGTAAQ